MHQLIVYRRIGSQGKTEMEHLTVKRFKVLSHKSSLILVKEGLMEVVDKDRMTGALYDHLRIFKVQFIASCETSLENELIVAFYAGEYPGRVEAHVIGGLPSTYNAEAGPIYVLDYKGYLDTCDLTGESKLSFIDYYRAVQDGDSKINSLLIHNEKNLNRDNQIELLRDNKV